MPLDPGHTIALGLACIASTLLMAPPGSYAMGIGSLVMIGIGISELRKPRRRRRNPRSVVAELDRERRRAERRADPW